MLTSAAGCKRMQLILKLACEQELLLILEEYWERNPELRNVPIYQASALARRAMSIYQTYIEMMNDDIRAAFQVRHGKAAAGPSARAWRHQR